MIISMANPEDFFWEALLKENEAPSPSPVFFELPPTPLANSDGSTDPSSLLDNQLLSYVTSMLMEDEMGSSAAVTNLQCVNRGSTEEANNMLPGSEVVRAFLKGMEEASKLLPRNNSFRMLETVDQVSSHGHCRGGKKKNHDRDEQQLEEELGRSSKLAAMTNAGTEEAGARELLDELMLHSHETCIKDMEKLRIDMDNEADKTIKKKGKKGSSSKVVDLRMLLIQCAQAMATDNQQSAGELLKKIKQHALATGDAMQRVAHYFAKGLEARLAGSGKHLYQNHVRMSLVEYLKVYKLYMAACCFKKVALMFAAMTIMQAVQGKKRLHIVDYGIRCGLHWPDLFRRLGSREDGPPEVRITIVDIPQPGFRPFQRIEAAGHCLSSCANEFRVPFRFQAVVAAKWETVGAEDLHIEPDEVLVVNDLWSFSALMDESIFCDGPNPRDVALRNISKMQPDVFIQGIINGGYGASFLSRFRGALLYYSALFDMLDATTPRESGLRLALEQNVLGPYALNAIACEGADLVERPEKYRQWQARNHRAGMQQLKLRPDIVDTIREEVNKYHHKDFLLGEDGQWLLQGWMGRVLFAHSAWVPQQQDNSSG
ncbi:scarecrow-like protein 9 [Oryza sativa Japonica Group]